MAVKFLLENGADVNAGDDFVHIYRTAREKGMYSVDGTNFIELM